MNTFSLSITSPDGEVFSENVLRIIVRGIEGDLAVMAGHIPFVTTVKKGECRVLLADETEKTGYADGGILAVSSEKVTFLSGSFHW
ncbi:MAG: hypothetical protein IJB70_04220 [Clostridia bacterium]|nr:hypothetical protein [Clostridia bacterium]